jgi:2-keto-3-deoxy-L-rhamnonate aldolase RhmA
MGFAGQSNEKPFKVRVATREPLVGIFVKTASHQVNEFLGRSGLDYVVIDAEHAPFDRAMLDVMILGARSVSLPCLVRVPNVASDTILSALDLGASGVVVPHVTDAGMAKDVVASARYIGGRRGFSPSPRFAGYGALDMKQVIASGDETATVICQIEDADGVRNAASIAAVAGVDGLMIGRADLALALGQTRLDAPEVVETVGRIIEAATEAGKTAAIVVGSVVESEKFRGLGATMFAIGSDQSLLQQATRQIAKDFAALEGHPSEGGSR